MDLLDVVLLWILAALALAGAILRILLARRQEKPLALGWKIQGFLFPLLVGIALVLYQSGTADLVFPLVGIGLIEELICGAIRRRSAKRETL